LISKWTTGQYNRYTFVDISVFNPTIKENKQCNVKKVISRFSQVFLRNQTTRFTVASWKWNVWNL